jgi:glycosyltransferase involved in cell wall biosynthesis
LRDVGSYWDCASRDAALPPQTGIIQVAVASNREAMGALVEYFVKEPLVFVVIINWNYARFVADAINSVKEQSYQNFQCILVDNGSDDSSVDRILEAIGDHPRFTLHRLTSNLGHLGAAVWSLEHVTGEFVTFLDADDVLAPTYLASHLQAHLAAASSVGFTSSNCVDVNAQGSLLTSGNSYMYKCWQQGVPGLRPIERTVRLRALDDSAYSALAQAVRFLPAHVPTWCWCPGSSNMFRRALLDRIRPTDASPAMFGGVDAFYLPILHALTGSLLIDQPLSAYRLHGSNDFSVLPSLNGIRGEHPRVAARSLATYVRMVSWLIDHLDEVLSIASAHRYWQILETAMSTNSYSPQIFSRPEFKTLLIRRYPQFVEVFGESRVFRELRRRMRFTDCLKLMLAARGRAFPVAEVGRALSSEIMRNSWRLYKESRRLYKKVT